MLIRIRCLQDWTEGSLSLSSKKAAWRIVGPWPTPAEWMAVGVEGGLGDLVKPALLPGKQPKQAVDRGEWGPAHGCLIHQPLEGDQGSQECPI